MKKILLYAIVALSSFALTPSAAAQETNANVNLASCIKETSNIGSNTYHNICNGTQRVVEWGTGDWLGAIGLSILAGTVCLVVVGVVIAFLYSLITDRF